jgi:hypothetical protein
MGTANLPEASCLEISIYIGLFSHRYSHPVSHHNKPTFPNVPIFILFACRWQLASGRPLTSASERLYLPTLMQSFIYALRLSGVVQVRDGLGNCRQRVETSFAMGTGTLLAFPCLA